MSAPALQMANSNIPKGTITSSFMGELVKKGFIDEEVLSKIKEDSDLSHFFQVKGRKKAKKSSSDVERNSEGYDNHRCCARVWKHEGGLGFDNIQCNSKNMIEPEKAESILRERDLTAEQEESIEGYLSTYDGCFCKKHLQIDFLMPNRYWLGKVNEPRPENPKLPLGSLKKGYTDEYKEHKWLFDSEGNKVEKKPRKKGGKKSSPSGLSNDEEKEFQEWKLAKEKAEQEKAEQEKAEQEKGEETDEMDEEVNDGELDSDPEEILDDTPYIVDGITYKKHWCEEDKHFVILETDDYSVIGVPNDEGGIDFKDEEDKEKHQAMIAKK